jgi:chemotaxis protein histidine kinase CheA/ActR/RegA family two-component response regulator
MEHDRILGYFLEEAVEHLHTIEQGLLNLAETVKQPATIRELFRAAHSIKGSAAMLGLTDVQQVGNQFESNFKLLKEQPQIVVDKQLQSLFLESFRFLQAGIEEVRTSKDPYRQDPNTPDPIGDPVFEELKSYLQQLLGTATGTPPTPTYQTENRDPALDQVFGEYVTRKLEELISLCLQPDQSTTRTQIQQICQKLGNLGENFEFLEWTNLFAACRLAIANPANQLPKLGENISIAVKQAQVLVLAHRQQEITVTPDLADSISPHNTISQLTLDNTTERFIGRDNHEIVLPKPQLVPVATVGGDLAPNFNSSDLFSNPIEFSDLAVNSDQLELNEFMNLLNDDMPTEGTWMQDDDFFEREIPLKDLNDSMFINSEFLTDHLGEDDRHQQPVIAPRYDEETFYTPDLEGINDGEIPDFLSDTKLEAAQHQPIDLGLDLNDTDRQLQPDLSPAIDFDLPAPDFGLDRPMSELFPVASAPEAWVELAAATETDRFSEPIPTILPMEFAEVADPFGLEVSEPPAPAHLEIANLNPIKPDVSIDLAEIDPLDWNENPISSTSDILFLEEFGQQQPPSENVVTASPDAEDLAGISDQLGNWIDQSIDSSEIDHLQALNLDSLDELEPGLVSAAINNSDSFDFGAFDDSNLMIDTAPIDPQVAAAEIAVAENALAEDNDFDGFDFDGLDGLPDLADLDDFGTIEATDDHNLTTDFITGNDPADADLGLFSNNLNTSDHDDTLADLELNNHQDINQLEINQVDLEASAPDLFANLDLPNHAEPVLDFADFDLGDLDVPTDSSSALEFANLDLPTDGLPALEFGDLDLPSDSLPALGFGDLDLPTDSLSALEFANLDLPSDGLPALEFADLPELDFNLDQLDNLDAEMSSQELTDLGNSWGDLPTDNLSAIDDLDALLGVDSNALSDTGATFDDLDALMLDAAPTPATNFDDLDALMNLANPVAIATATAAVAVDAGAALTVKPDLESSSKPKADRKSAKQSRTFEQTMRVSVRHLDNLNNLVGELVVNRNTLEQDQNRMRQFVEKLLSEVQKLNDVGKRMQDLYERSLMENSLIASRQQSKANANANANASIPQSGEDVSGGLEYDPLEMDRFTPIHLLSQKMIELTVRVRESTADIEFVVDGSTEVTRGLRQITGQLQEDLTKSRMIPFAQTADRLQRGVRDNGLKYGKQVELSVEGRDTLIDKVILESLTDPLIHMVNNGIAHGIESIEARQAAGKPAEGKIMIRALHQGNQTIISISDDGAGIDTERVKQKAIEKGIITPQKAATMAKSEIYDLLFLPSFSTKDQADELAGRGVGMDVVRTSITEIRGTITTESTLGVGTTFTIRLPLALSIAKALIAVNNKCNIAFPMDGIEDTQDVSPEQIQTNSNGEQSIFWRDEMMPFKPLSELLEFNRPLMRNNFYTTNEDDTDLVSILILRSDGNFTAVQVDKIIGDQEIAIKPLQGPASKPLGIAGATVMGDGRIIPIADVMELIDLAKGTLVRHVSAEWTTQMTAPTVQLPESMVLIVDDSITVRELLSLTFKRAGYRVEQARDGQEAWDKLRAGLPCDIVFCDIEMPRMDGLEFLSRVQKDASLSKVPVAMLTSRGSDRHRQIASQLGASGYFIKPYLEEALLDAAKRMIKGEVLQIV